MSEEITNVGNEQSVNIESSVNAEPVGNVDSQNQNIQETSDSVNDEVAPSQNDKPVQSQEENAKYAAARREAEQKAKQKQDSFAKKFGYDSFEEMEQAQIEQEQEAERARIQEETGVDPDQLKSVFEQLKNNDPDFQELQAIRAEKNISKSLTDLNNELKDAGIDLEIKNLSNEEVAKIPNANKVAEFVQRGHTLADAFFLANKKDIISKQVQKAEQDTIAKINANGASSPGSLSSGNNDNTNFISKEMFESKKNDQRWCIDNVSKLAKSCTKW